MGTKLNLNQIDKQISKDEKAKAEAQMAKKVKQAKEGKIIKKL